MVYLRFGSIFQSNHQLPFLRLWEIYKDLMNKIMLYLKGCIVSTAFELSWLIYLQRTVNLLVSVVEYKGALAF